MDVVDGLYVVRRSHCVVSREVDTIGAKSICIYCYLLMIHFSSSCMLFSVAVSNFCSHMKVPLNDSKLTNLGLINWYVNVVVIQRCASNIYKYRTIDEVY